MLLMALPVVTGELVAAVPILVLVPMVVREPNLEAYAVPVVVQEANLRVVPVPEILMVQPVEQQLEIVILPRPARPVLVQLIVIKLLVLNAELQPVHVIQLKLVREHLLIAQLIVT